jgi:hypothetical protein
MALGKAEPMDDIVQEVLTDLLEQECILHNSWNRTILLMNQSEAKRIAENQTFIWEMLGFAIPNEDWPRFLGTMANMFKRARQEEALIN